MGEVISKGSTFVSKGQTLQSPDILSSGRVFVLSGGTVSSANIHHGGFETVSNGGVDISAYVYSGGGMRVLSGGIASGYYVISSSYISAFGGILLGGDIGRGGQVIVDGMQGSTSVTKGVISGANILNGGGAVINLNAVGSTLKLQSGTIHVSSGGSIVNTYIGSGTGDSRGAIVHVQNGASAHLTHVHSNGILDVWYGAHVSQTTVSSGGSVIVSSGGIISGTTAFGGVVDILPTGSAQDTVVQAYGGRGGMYISSGGSATRTTIQSGASLTILKGGFAFGKNYLKDGGALFLNSGAYAFSFEVSGGTVNVSAGAIASNFLLTTGTMTLRADSAAGSANASADWISVLSSGVVYVSSGASITSSFIQGGFMAISSGGDAKKIEVGESVGSGTIRVHEDGYASDVTIFSGGTADVDGGHLKNANVRTSGNLLVSSGYVSGGSVYGKVSVFSGGSVNALNVLLLGSMDVMGVADNCTIYSGGRVFVSSGGRLSNAYVSTGGIFYVSSGGTAMVNSGIGISAMINGGNMFVSSARVNRVNLHSGGAFTARESSYISRGGISAGTLALSAGCSAAEIQVYGLGTEVALAQLTVMSSAITSNGIICGVDGRLKVNSGGYAKNMQIASAGTATISGIIESCTVSSGGYIKVITSGALASRTYVGEGGFMELNSGTGAVVTSICSGGALYVQSGARANTVYVSSGGQFLVKTGGSAFSAYISQGGIATINSSASLLSATLFSGGLLNINGGEATTVIVSSAADLVVAAGAGRLADILDGGRLTIVGGYVYGCNVKGGGSALGVGGAFWGNVSSGGQVVLSGGSVVEMTVHNGGKAKIAKSFNLAEENWIALSSGGILDFDISNQTGGGSALLGEFQRVSGNGAVYTLTVGDTQAKAEYLLATNAASFNKSITVQNTAGETLGSLNVGQIVNIGGVNYALNLGADDVLSVTVGAAVFSGTVKSDIDGNGISDVMFVWTGEYGDGNYQHGYWMNGTSEWQSQNSSHPAEWDNLGCHDMTGDGKADSVLFGNVTSEAGIHGAYIGYYADANDLPDGSTWVNIGYLTNEENIDWKNVVGNLTGNASGVNSIVWYTYELGALGAWTDGTENWVSIGTGFDASWTLIGCGDFSGDGRDQVVMAHNSGAEYHAIDIDGTWTNLGASDSGWEVRAIGDFSGDGKDDIVAFHKETGLVAKWADGLSSGWSKLGQLDAKDWFIVGCGDYNSDGNDDLLVRQYSSGMLGYYASGNMETGWVELGRGVDMNWTVIA